MICYSAFTICFYFKLCRSVQAGYLGLEGPAEARYGYTAPRLVDWDGDGDLDVVASDATSRVMLYRNVGSRRRPRLAVPLPLLADGLEVHGPWRVQPWAGRFGTRTAGAYTPPLISST
jgi:hypothetical protein